MKRKILTLLAAVLAAFPLFAGPRHAGRDTLSVVASDTLTDAYLDTVNLKRNRKINDYSMIGFQYGVSLNRMQFNPSKKQDILLTPANFGIVYTHYGKMFGFMPYFGYQLMLSWGQDGYKTQYSEQTKTRPDVDGAYQAIYDYVEFAAMSHLHLDVGDNFKIIGNIGPYGAWRYHVERSGNETLDPKYVSSFYDYDRKLDYGIRGGVGMGLMFSPVEFHVTAQLRWSFGTLYDPDYHSEYYYRFAYPLDIVIQAGVHIQLTKRTGKTRSALRREARSLVYDVISSEKEKSEENGKVENIDGESR